MNNVHYIGVMTRYTAKRLATSLAVSTGDSSVDNRGGTVARDTGNCVRDPGISHVDHATLDRATARSSAEIGGNLEAEPRVAERNACPGPL